MRALLLLHSEIFSFLVKLSKIISDTQHRIKQVREVGCY